MEVKFDQFSSVEGFDSARDCLNEINALVQKDEADRKKMMKDLQNQLRKAQQMWNKRCQLASSSVVEEGSNQISDAADAKAESKTATEGGSKHHGDSKELARADGKATAAAAADEEDIDDELGDAMELPVMMFFQPMSMDTMLDQVQYVSERHADLTCSTCLCIVIVNFSIIITMYLLGLNIERVQHIFCHHACEAEAEEAAPSHAQESCPPTGTRSRTSASIRFPSGHRRRCCSQ